MGTVSLKCDRVCRGQNLDGSRVCAHSATADRDAGSVQYRRWHQARLYIAVPRSVSCELDVVLSQVGLLDSRQVYRLHVPDCFLERVYDECA